MKKKGLTILFTMLLGVCASTPALPITVFPGTDANKPTLFYITGDGGWNRFSTLLVNGLHTKGYSVIGLNALTYFWNKKTPAEVALAINAYLRNYLAAQQTKRIILIGYSFGADVIPFIENRLSPDVFQAIERTLLLSPSSKTDFDIHPLGNWGLYGGQSVPDEISRVAKPVTVVFGTEEKPVAFERSKANRTQVVRLTGDHHYNGDVVSVVRFLLPWLK